MSGEDGLANQEATRRAMAAMRDELAGPHPSRLEHLLVERIVLGWLHVSFLEQCAVSAMQQGARPEPRPEVQLEFETKRITANQKWLDRAHHRYLTALKALAQVRKLRLPSLQVNLAENQVNVRS